MSATILDVDAVHISDTAEFFFGARGSEDQTKVISFKRDSISMELLCDLFDVIIT